MKNRYKRRTLIVLLGFLFTALTIAVGLAIWIITDIIKIKPELEVQRVLINYLDGQEGTYNGDILLPSSKYLGLEEDGNLTYQYKLSTEADSEYKSIDASIPQGPINVGIYTIKVFFYDEVSVNGLTPVVVQTSTTVDFEIKPSSDFSDLTAYFNNNPSAIFFYTEADIPEIETDLIVENSKATFEKGVDYTVSFPNKTDIGDYTATITFTGRNYTGEFTVDYHIAYASLDVAITEDEIVTSPDQDEYQFTYIPDGYSIANNVKIVNSRGDEIEGATLNCYYKLPTEADTEYKLFDNTSDPIQLPINVGIYNIKITATVEGYSEPVEKVITLTIKKRSINNASISLTQTEYTYDGTKHEPGIASGASIDGYNLVGGNDYKVEWTNNDIAGTNTALTIISGINNYEGQVVLTFTINPTSNYILTAPTLKNNKSSNADNKIIEGETLTINNDGSAPVVGTFTPQFPEGISSFSDYTLTTGLTTATEEKTLTLLFTPTATNANGVYNYLPKEVSQTFIMYAVATNSSVYYGTVEKALAANTSGTINVIPNIYENTGYYPTIKQTSEDVNIASGVTLQLAYTATYDSTSNKYTGFTSHLTDSDAASAATTSSYTACLKVNSGVTIICNGIIQIGAVVKGESGGIVYAPAKLMNHGEIVLKSGADLNSYGFLKGNGIIIAESGSDVLETIYITDWPGGTNALGMKKANVFPFQTFNFTNITCDIQLFNGANLKTWCQINASDTWVMAEGLLLCGSGGLFELNGEASDYILIEVENTTKTSQFNDNFNVTNIDITYRNKLSLYGNFTDNKIKVSLPLGQSIETSTSMAMPIGLMKLQIISGTATLKSNSYKFLPGSSLVVEEGANLVINSGVNIIFYDETYRETYTYLVDGAVVASGSAYYYHLDHSAWYNTYNGTDALGSQFILKGSCTCNGSIAGKIRAGGEKATLTLVNDTAAITVLTSLNQVTGAFEKLNGSKTSTKSDLKNAMARLYMGDELGVSAAYNVIVAGSYNSILDTEGNYGWYSSNLSLGYDLNGGEGTTPSDSASKTVGEGYVVQTSDLPGYPNYDTLGITRQGYRFVGWTLDSAGTKDVIPGTTTLYVNTIFYIKWELIEYDISYENIFYENFSSGNGFTLNENPEKFNVLTNKALKNPTKDTLVFGGWYIDETCKNKINILDGTVLFDVLQSVYDEETGEYKDKAIIYALWYPVGTEPYKVTYIINNENLYSGLTCPEYEELIVVDNQWETQIWRDLSVGNDKKEYNQYFVGWFKEPEFINEVTDFSADIFTENAVTLYAKWETKQNVNFTYTLKGADNEDIVIEQTYYIYKNETLTLPDVAELAKIVKDESGNNNYFILNKLTWLVGDESKNVGESITITEDTQITAVVTSTYYWKLTTTTSNATPTITISNGSYCLSFETINILEAGTETISDNSEHIMYISNNATLSVTPGYTYSERETESCTFTSHTMVSATTLDVRCTGSCITSNTLVTLADGTQKYVEDITPDDYLLVYNHETGTYDIAKVLFNDYDAEAYYTVINLEFSNGVIVKVVSEHGFFDLDLNKYVYIDELNYSEFVGHKFYTSKVIDGNIVDGSIILINAYLTTEYVKVYSPVTKYHLNYFTEGILSMPGGIKGLFNIFELDENLKYDEELMQQDIEKYGLLTYDDFKDLVPIDIYESYPAKYFAVSIGKGLMTWDDIIYYIERYGPLTES